MKQAVKILSGCIIGLFLSTLGRADEGGWSGNGGEPLRMAENVWFIGQESIPYCVVASEDYPIPAVQLKSMVAEVLKQWFDFFKLYGIDGESKERLPRPRPFGPLASPAKGISMATHFVEVDCTAATHFALERLRFQFGVSNAMIDAYRAFNPEEPLGVAMKRSKDDGSYGYVWIDSFSSDALRVKHLLLHEIGHVLGMGHNSVAVMNEHIVDDLNPDPWRKDAVEFGQIETNAWPYRLRKDNPINLGLGGILRARPQFKKSMQLCNGSHPAPRNLIRELGLDPRECYDLVLNPEAVESNRIVLSLSVRGKTSSQTFRGEFRPFALSDILPKGPKFQILEPKRPRWVSYIFDPSAVLDSWQGNLDIGGRPIAAQLFFVKGVALDLHLPSLKGWVMLRSNVQP